MSTNAQAVMGTARAVADLEEGLILATVEVAASPQRVFRVLASTEIIAWWIRPGVFNTAEWTGDVRAGGAWRASGTGGGQPYVLEGRFTEVDAPSHLEHTWQAVGAPGAPTTVTYRVAAVAGGSRITLKHGTFASPEVCANTCLGWETSFEQLARFLSAESPPTPR